MRKRKTWLPGILLAACLVAEVSGCGKTDGTKSPPVPDEPDTGVSETAGEAFITEVNGNIPGFDDSVTKAFPITRYVKYYDLDQYGRGVGMEAVISPDMLRENSVPPARYIHPTGYHRVWYDNIEKVDGTSGSYLFRRCHFLKTRLGGCSDDQRNFFTGTYQLNYREGMGQYEMMILSYIRDTGNHVAYRVTSRYTGENLVADGIELEALSLEDDGEGIRVHVFIRNIQEGIHINYDSGTSYLER